MRHRCRSAFFSAVLATAIALSSLAASPPVERITDDDLDQASNFNRACVTSRGQILFLDVSSDFTVNTVMLFDGTDNVTVQEIVGFDNVESTVFVLGPGDSPGEVVGAWRRGAGDSYVSVDGGPPVMNPLNPEHASVSDGCVFMVLQDPPTGTHAFKVDPATGGGTKLSSGEVQLGALRIASSGCNKAAWTWAEDNDDPTTSLYYWNGSSAQEIETAVSGMASFASGILVYTKLVSGIRQVFVYDTNASLPSPVQVSAETDATKLLSPVTDGRHLAWYRANDDGSEAQIILNGGLVFPAGEMAELYPDKPIVLDRGQLLWESASGSYFYYDGRQTHFLDPSPATTMTNPWLADGFLSFIGLSDDGDPDKELFRIVGTPPAEGNPSAPMYLTATPGTNQVTYEWDAILGADSYNLYIAEEVGVTKAGYASLTGGRRITGVTSPHTVTDLATNTSYFAVVTSVDGAIEGPESREVAATLVGNLTWQSVGGLSGIQFYSLAADPSSFFDVWAGADGNVYASEDGGTEWSEVLTSATTGAQRTAALAALGGTVWANMMTQADIWRSVGGAAFTRVLEADGFGEQNGSIAVDPENPAILYAGDFILGEVNDPEESLVIKSIDGGANWLHTPEGPELGDEIHAYGLTIDPSDSSTIYAGGGGTPNVAKSIDGAANWTSAQIPGGGEVHSIAVDPNDPDVVYASTRDHGVFRSGDGGLSWEQKSNGLAGLADESFPVGEGFHAILIDPRNSLWLHLGAGNGYWYSLDGGENWISDNDGFPGGTAWIYDLALTPARRLIAATDAGLYQLSVGPPPVVGNVTPDEGPSAGGTVVTIGGSGFQPGAVVTFDNEDATDVEVVSATKITATTPANPAGPADVTVTNFDGGSGTLAAGFTYALPLPDMPTGVGATAETTTSVEIEWNVSANATSYRVFRRSPGTGFVQIGTSTDNSFEDDTVTAANSYLYRVRAVNATGSSGNSASDIATTVFFANDPLNAGTPIRAQHLVQARVGIDAVRELAGRGQAVYTNVPAGGLVIRAIDLAQMRTALDEATGDLGRGTGGFTNASLTGIAAKAVHIQELRDKMQ